MAALLPGGKNCWGRRTGWGRARAGAADLHPRAADRRSLQKFTSQGSPPLMEMPALGWMGHAPGPSRGAPRQVPPKLCPDQLNGAYARAVRANDVAVIGSSSRTAWAGLAHEPSSR